VTPPAELHPALAPLAFLLGTWSGEGVGGYPTIEDFGFGQELTFSHYGKPLLEYTSRSWSLEDGRPMARESGWWRPGADGAVELVLAHPMGVVEVWLGTVVGTRVEIGTDVVARTPSAKDVTAGRRLYGLVGDELMWAYDMAAVEQPLQPHLSARLRRT
jgi:hypothetical protein